MIRRLKPREGNGFVQGHTASSGRAGIGTHVSCLSKAYSLEKPLVLLSCFSLASINGWELLILAHAGSSGNGGGRGEEENRMGGPWLIQVSLCDSNYVCWCVCVHVHTCGCLWGLGVVLGSCPGDGI